MSELKEEFTHKFVKSFEYIEKGQKSIATDITINAPSNSVYQYTLCFEEAQAIAQRNATEMLGNMKTEKIKEIQKMKEEYDETKEKEEKEEKESDDKMALAIVSNIMATGRAAKCFEALLNLLKSGNTEYPCAVINGIEKVTKPIFDKMSPIDTKLILGKYILNFLEYSPDS